LVGRKNGFNIAKRIPLARYTRHQKNRVSETDGTESPTVRLLEK
jgi:hypothetical protein